MSTELTAWVWSQKDISPVEKLTLLALARFYCSDTGECCPSMAQVVEITGLSDSSVRKNISSLVEKYLIYKEQRFASDGTSLSNTYIFLLSQRED